MVSSPQPLKVVDINVAHQDALVSIFRKVPLSLHPELRLTCSKWHDICDLEFGKYLYTFLKSISGSEGQYGPEQNVIIDKGLPFRDSIKNVFVNKVGDVKFYTHWGRESIFLRREVMGLRRGDGCNVKHINKDKLDCRKSNLVVSNADRYKEIMASRFRTDVPD